MKTLLFVSALVGHLAATLLAIRGSFDQLATQQAGLARDLPYESAMSLATQLLKFPVVSITAEMLQLPAGVRLAAYLVNSALWAGVLVWIIEAIVRGNKKGQSPG